MYVGLSTNMQLVVCCTACMVHDEEHLHLTPYSMHLTSIATNTNIHPFTERTQGIINKYCTSKDNKLNGVHRCSDRSRDHCTQWGVIRKINSQHCAILRMLI